MSATTPGETRDVSPETMQRLKQNARLVKSWLTKLGSGGEFLNPIYRKEWLTNGIPGLALRILSDLEEGALGNILVEEVDRLKFIGDDIFAGFFRGPKDRIYPESQAMHIYPQACQLDKDLKEALGLE